MTQKLGFRERVPCSFKAPYTYLRISIPPFYAVLFNSALVSKGSWLQYHQKRAALLSKKK